MGRSQIAVGYRSNWNGMMKTSVDSLKKELGGKGLEGNSRKRDRLWYLWFLCSLKGKNLS